jgi:hypothetical protein
LGISQSPRYGKKVYIKFLKQTLNVKHQTTDATVYGEVGKVPLVILKKKEFLSSGVRLLGLRIN